MFSTTDYIEYFKQLYAIEETMEAEARALKKLIKNPEAQELLSIMEADEKRHKLIVKSMRALVAKHIV